MNIRQCKVEQGQNINLGEGNGNPLPCSCLENPRDEGAWWAAVYGVAQSWTRLKRLSIMSSRTLISVSFTAAHLLLNTFPYIAPFPLPHSADISGDIFLKTVQPMLRIGGHVRKIIPKGKYIFPVKVGERLYKYELFSQILT